MTATVAHDPGVATRPTIHSIQVMRAVAAIAVAIYHTGLILANPEYGGRVIFPRVSGVGWTGVNFFFVLSGFIIIYAHAGDIGRPHRAGRYLWRRFSRIYPLYWMCLTAFLIAAVGGLGHPDIRWTASDLASSYLLLPWVANLVLPIHVAWTLTYEIGFYALFLLLILNRRLGLAAFALWAAAIVVGGIAMRAGISQFIHAWNINFLLGIGAWALSRRTPPRLGLPIMALGIVLFAALIAAGMIDSRIGTAQTSPFKLVLIGVAFTLILLGGVLWDRHVAWKAPAALLLLGEASYAIYLVHAATISLLAAVHHRLGVELPGALLFAATAAGSVVAGVGVHLLVERPILRRMRNGVGHARAEASGAVPVEAEGRR